nr:uncharacterized protein LOC112773926 [Arachis hypogaea]
MVMPKKKFYVVFHGKKHGIYNNWPECFTQVNGFNGNLHKSYEDYNQARIACEDFLENQQSQHQGTSIQQAAHQDPLHQTDYATTLYQRQATPSPQPHLITQDSYSTDDDFYSEDLLNLREQEALNEGPPCCVDFPFVHLL